MDTEYVVLMVFYLYLATKKERITNMAEYRLGAACLIGTALVGLIFIGGGIQFFEERAGRVIVASWLATILFFLSFIFGLMACLTNSKPADQKAEIEVREVLATAAEQARQEAIEHESQSEEHEEREE